MTSDPDVAEAVPEAEAPAFLQAVVELGARRPITTSQAIYNAQGVKLLEGGVAIDQGLYDRLVSHRLALPLDECVETGGGLDATALREAALAVIERLPFFARAVPAGAARNLILDAISDVALPKPVALHLELARETRPALFEHGILMALLAAHLARDSGAGRFGIGLAATAGLLHDLGMLHIDPELLDSDDRLSGDRLRPVYVHPLTTSMLVDRFPAYPKEVVRAIVEHHERLDGSGYPRGLVGAAMSPLGRTLALAEVVTAMFDGERLHPEQRVSLLLRVNPRRYDPKGVAAIHKLLASAQVPAAAEVMAAAPLIERLLKAADVLATWPATGAALAAASGAAQAPLLQSMNEQNATLQRMLHDAGVTDAQLRSLGEEAADDVAFRVELWTLAEELLWQLHAAANQLERRWRDDESDARHPPALTAWLGAVAALDDTEVHSPS
ncbi:MAG: HD domain-containing phosphohydrolase [Caldimonas sp.]